ncbi:heme ABC transporter permease CcmC [Bartonella sp. TP]|uniref:heme ABC transporter permease CcmC n=1 Tax=Bartonella sp. TP TaxID=3057550 RepID=UPI0025B0E945|nr:heme ABC transporter permease CcmC [Bartonella sp. TP]MDN5248622.1 heme ABC transporter permease CcmC [Alphaproteobacteria bacterium]WJW80424.1 heme ABC transporter permease CcmC [Bartonella sp. TP]
MTNFTRYIAHILTRLQSIALWLLLPALVIAAFFIAQAPQDYQQHELVKLLYLHVPCAWLSLQCYAVMCLAALLFLFSNHSFYGAALKAMAPIGAFFTLLTLICGSLWGAKTWGSWWEWDARLVSELILFFIYCAISALSNSFRQDEKADYACSILTLIGSINLPIIKFSTQWWHSLHQNSTIHLLGHSSLAPGMMHALLSMLASFNLIAIILYSLALQIELLTRAYKKRAQIRLRLSYKREQKYARQAKQ